MKFELKEIDFLRFPFGEHFDLALDADLYVLCIDDEYINLSKRLTSVSDVKEADWYAQECGFKTLNDMLVTVPSDILSIDELWDFLDPL
jgi:hypothetical protein